MQTTGTKGATAAPRSAEPERGGRAGREERAAGERRHAVCERGRFAAVLTDAAAGSAPARGGQAGAAVREGPALEHPEGRTRGDREPVIVRVLREMGEARDEGRPERPAAEARDELAPFQPPNPALSAPPAAALAQPAAAGSAAAHAEAAALAERLVTSMRVGRVGRDGHEVRMRLALRADSRLDVRLRMMDGRLTAVLAADPGHRADAQRIAESLEDELAERGLRLDAIEVE